VLCPTCVYLAQEHDAVEEEPGEAEVRAWAAFEDRLKSNYRASAATDRCWWCERPAKVLPLETYGAYGKLEYANPALCGVCEGLSLKVGGGFDAERAAQEQARAEFIGAVTQPHA
jgi:hypothetical protein